MKRYAQRVVLFADILGFRNAIAESQHRPELVEQVSAAVDRIFSRRAFYGIRSYTYIREDNSRKQVEIKDREYIPRVYTFSDNIAVSLPPDPSGLAIALYQAVLLFGELAQNLGLLLRGAVSVGQLYDDENCIFGPALVEAADLEKKQAINPRIILSPEAVTLYERLGELKTDDGEDSIEIPYLLPSETGELGQLTIDRPLTRVDADDRTFLDVFNVAPTWQRLSHPQTEGFQTRSSWLADLGRHVEEQLIRFKEDEYIASKYKWLRDQIKASTG